MSPAAAVEASRAAVEAVWRIESAKVIGALARTLGDLDAAEEFAQDALVQALEQWPKTGVPRNPAAWLTTVARRRAVDSWRRRVGLDERQTELARRLEAQDAAGPPGLAPPPPPAR